MDSSNQNQVKYTESSASGIESDEYKGYWRHALKELPEDGQQVYYFGPDIGLWVGHYKYSPDDMVSPHLFLNMNWGVVDRMDAPYWMPYDAERAKSWCPLPPEPLVGKVKP